MARYGTPKPTRSSKPAIKGMAGATVTGKGRAKKARAKFGERIKKARGRGGR